MKRSDRSLVEVIVEALEGEDLQRREECLKYIKECSQKQPFMVDRVFRYSINNGCERALSQILDCVEVETSLTLKERVAVYQLLHQQQR